MSAPHRALITARYASRCAACGRRIIAGERAGWARDAELVCARCYRWSREPAPAPRRVRVVVARATEAETALDVYRATSRRTA